MDSTDNSNDDNDLEVATVLASAIKENIYCENLGSQSNPNPPRSSTLLTNLPRGNSVNFSQSSDSSLSSVYELAAKGELYQIKKLFFRTAKQEKLESPKKHPLLAAARNGWIHVVEYLLEQGEPVNETGEEKMSALHHACAEGYPKVVKVLLQFGSEVNMCCSKGNTALHYAIYSKDCSCIHVLLQAGADMTIANGAGFTAVEYAYKINSRTVEQVFQKYLLELYDL